MENEKDAMKQGAEAEENAVNQAEQQQVEELSSLLEGSIPNATNNNDSEEQSRMFPGVL